MDNIIHKMAPGRTLDIIKGILLMSFCTMTYVFMVCFVAHMALKDFYVISESADEKWAFANFMFFDTSGVSNAFVADASETLKGFLMLSFLIPWLGFLHAKFNPAGVKIASRLVLLYYIAVNMFLAYVYYKLDIAFVLPDVAHQLAHAAGFLICLVFLIFFLGQIKLINDKLVNDGAASEIARATPLQFYSATLTFFLATLVFLIVSNFPR